LPGTWRNPECDGSFFCGYLRKFALAGSGKRLGSHAMFCPNTFRMLLVFLRLAGIPSGADIPLRRIEPDHFIDGGEMDESAASGNGR